MNLGSGTHNLGLLMDLRAKARKQPRTRAMLVGRVH